MLSFLLVSVKDSKEHLVVQIEIQVPDKLRLVQHWSRVLVFNVPRQYREASFDIKKDDRTFYVDDDDW